MLSRRIFILALISVTALTGCPPKQNKKETLRTGRTRYSPTGPRTSSGTVGSYTSSNSNTSWGGITGVDQNFDNAVRTLAAPSMETAPASDQLGYVSPQPGQSGGIYFWGNVYMSQSGTIDSSRSKLHLEIYDSNYGMQRADGSFIEQLFIHVGADQEGFMGVQGNIQQIVFQASYNTFLLQGQVQGGQYVGTIYFANRYTQDFVLLGQFQVAAQGFFMNY